MSNRRGSISVFSPPIETPRNSIVEETPEVKGIKSIKDELAKLNEEVNKQKLVKPCRCRCNDVEARLIKQIDKITKQLKELIEN